MGKAHEWHQRGNSHGLCAADLSLRSRIEGNASQLKPPWDGRNSVTIDGGLRKLFQTNIPYVHWVSVESGGTSRGIPDANGCLDGKEFWIEFKQCAHWKVPLRAEQIGWLLRRTRAGGRTFIAVRRADTELWLFNGSGAKQLAELGLKACRDQAFGVWHGGPAAWDWAKIAWWLQQ
jgi:hypothetical protein